MVYSLDGFIFVCSAKHILCTAYKEHVVIYMQIEIFFRDMQLLVHRMQKLNKQYYVGLRMISNRISYSVTFNDLISNNFMFQNSG